MAHSGVYVRYGKGQGSVEKSEKNKLLTVNQVKARLSCSRTHVYNMIENGKLKAFKIGEIRGVRILSVMLRKLWLIKLGHDHDY